MRNEALKVYTAGFVVGTFCSFLPLILGWWALPFCALAGALGGNFAGRVAAKLT